MRFLAIACAVWCALAFPEDRPAIRKDTDKPSRIGMSWHAWDADLFAEAKRLDRPILLVVEARWSPWESLVDSGSPAAEETAALAGSSFVAARVDRDRRPDVDVRCQEAVRALGSAAGWPLVLFLTPDGGAITGGVFASYRDDWVRERPGLLSVQRRVADAWRTQRDRTRREALAFEEALRQTSEPKSQPLPDDLLARTAGALQQALDAAGGGFGRGEEGPKFPAPKALELALAHFARTGEGRSREVLTRTLDGMLRGGIYDRLGGGFHRCARDRRWRIPRFERLLALDAETIPLLLHAGQATGEAAYTRAAEQAVAWWTENLSDRERGGFFASQDGEHGEYYTWTVKEVEAALPEERTAALVKRAFGIGEWGDLAESAPHRNVLYEHEPLAVAARALGIAAADAEKIGLEALARLRVARRARTAPPIDRAILVDANARMVSAVLETSAAAGREEWRAFALKTLDRLLAQAVDSKRGAGHVIDAEGSASFPRLSADEGALALACQDAFAATDAKRYLEEARASLQRLEASFQDPRRTGGGKGPYLDRSTDRAADAEAVGRLGESVCPYQDASVSGPPVNAVAALALLRFSWISGEPGWAERAKSLLESFGGTLEQAAPYAPSLVLAQDARQHGFVTVAVRGESANRATQQLLEAAHAAYAPHKLVFHLGEKDELPIPGCERPPPGAAPVAYVWAGSRLLAAEPTAEKLRATVEKAGRR